MSLKILGGIASGLNLYSPEGDRVRPTVVRLKRSFFDAFQGWEGLSFFDVCAGTGAVGLEAWSRGADKLILVESHLKTQKTLKKNIDLIAGKYAEDFLERKIKMVAGDAYHWVRDFKKNYENWKDSDRRSVVVFFDPPYDQHKLYEKILEIFFGDCWFKGFLVVESDEKKGLKLDEMRNWGEGPSRVFTQGDSFLAIYSFS